MIEIYEVTAVSAKLTEALERLLPQLSQSAQMPTTEQIETLLNNPNTYLFVAENEGEIIGMLSLVVVDIPTGRKAWIEDVVVDEALRGLGVGALLVERAKVEAANLGAKKIYLTSNPSRKAAHALYEKCGFERYDTTLFRINIVRK
jgi:GNAT superfamily N-acetyltransferase